MNTEKINTYFKDHLHVLSAVSAEYAQEFEPDHLLPYPELLNELSAVYDDLHSIKQDQKLYRLFADYNDFVPTDLYLEFIYLISDLSYFPDVAKQEWNNSPASDFIECLNEIVKDTEFYDTEFLNTASALLDKFKELGKE